MLAQQKTKSQADVLKWLALAAVKSSKNDRRETLSYAYTNEFGSAASDGYRLHVSRNLKVAADGEFTTLKKSFGEPGRFPNWDVLFPQYIEFTARVNKSQLEQALAVASVFSDSVTLIFEPESIVLQSVDPFIGDTQIVIAARYDTPAYGSIHVKNAYLEAAIDIFGDYVDIMFTGKNNPLVIGTYSDGFNALIMPEKSGAQFPIDTSLPLPDITNDVKKARKPGVKKSEMEKIRAWRESTFKIPCDLRDIEVGNQRGGRMDAVIHYATEQEKTANTIAGFINYQLSYSVGYNDKLSFAVNRSKQSVYIQISNRISRNGYIIKTARNGEVIVTEVRIDGYGSKFEFERYRFTPGWSFNQTLQAFVTATEPVIRRKFPEMMVS